MNTIELKQKADKSFRTAMVSGLAALALGGFGAVVCASKLEAPETQKSKDYSSLTNYIEVTAQPGDNLSELMTKYSGEYPKGKNLYTWQMDNDKSNGQLTAGKTYRFRTK